MEERSVGKTQPSPAGSGRSFPRGRGDTWVNEAARDATCCSARARPCGRGVLSQTVLTQGSTQVRAHRPGQVGSGSPPGPFLGLSGARGVARAWRRAGRSCRTVALQTGSQEGLRERVTPAGGPAWRREAKPWNLPGNSGPPALRRQAG